MKLYEFSQGRTPLFISMPHDGTRIPGDLEARMTKRALQRPDTDWHVARLYQFSQDLGASLIRPLYHRYVVDLNRAPDNTTLYPGSSNTEVCPSSCFDDSPIYRDGAVPDATEVAERIDTYWRPYHQRLQQELARIRNAHGVALLYEAHTIRSRVPRFFEGVLPDFNLGTADGKSCAPALTQRLADQLAQIEGASKAAISHAPMASQKTISMSCNWSYRSAHTWTRTIPILIVNSLRSKYNRHSSRYLLLCSSGLIRLNRARDAAVDANVLARDVTRTIRSEESD
jgi:N-formylglutamate deformylase